MGITTKSYRRLLPDLDDQSPRLRPSKPDQVIVDTSRDRYYKALDPSGFTPPQQAAGTGAHDVSGPKQDPGATDISLHRLWRESTVWVAGCVEMRGDDVVSAHGGCRARNPRASTDELDGVRLGIEHLLHNPYPSSAPNKDDGDPDADHASLMGSCTDDLLITGQMVIKPSRRKNGEIWRLEPFDSTRVTPNREWTPGSREGRWVVDLGRDDEQKVGYNELIVVRLHPRTYADTGLAPITAIHRFLLGELDTFRSLHYLNKTMQPSGVLKIPTPNNRTITKIINQWRQRVQGKGGIVVANLPADSSFIKVGNDTLPGSMDFIDLVLRAIGFGFRIPSIRMNWTRTSLDRTEEGQGEIYDEGKFNLLRLWARVITRRILPSYDGGEQLEWFYTELDSLSDQAESAQVINAKAGGDVHVYPIAKLWEDAGLGDLPYTDQQLQADPDLRANLFEPRMHVGNAIYVPASRWSKHINTQLAQQSKDQPGVANTPPALPSDSPQDWAAPQGSLGILPARFGEDRAQRFLSAGDRPRLSMVQREADLVHDRDELADSFARVFADEEEKLRGSNSTG